MNFCYLIVAKKNIFFKNGIYSETCNKPSESMELKLLPSISLY